MKKLIIMLVILLTGISAFSQTKIRVSQIEPIQGTFIKSLGEASGKVLTTNGSGGAIWQTSTIYAPLSGSDNYIQNQNASAQTANMWISGTGTFGTQLLVGFTPPTAIEANIVAPQIATTSNAEESYQVANYGQVQGMISGIAGNYIQNQNASAQTANMWISGSGIFQIGRASCRVRV